MHTQSLAVSQADNARTAEALHHTLLIQMRRAVAFLATVAPHSRVNQSLIEIDMNFAHSLGNE